MNNFKKIGLTALAASLVSVSANAGSMSVSGGASMNASGYTGEGQNRGATFTMGNQLTFSGSGELDNGLSVSVSFVLDQGDNDLDHTTTAEGAAPFDSHSVTVSSDTLGSLKLMGEGGASTASAISGTAAGNLWDTFDQMTANAVSIPDLSQTASPGDDSFMYTSPELMEGLTATLSFEPQNSGTESGTGYGINYTGVEGLSLAFAEADVVGADTDTSGTNTQMDISYAYGPVTVSYSQGEHDEGASSGANDVEMTSMAVTYTVTDELSITYGQEESDQSSTATDAEISAISFAYTAGGMTLSGKMTEGENLNYTTATAADMDAWTLGASFAF
jgi:outer membrane protein OmpU